MDQGGQENQTADGFTKVTNRRRGNKKHTIQTKLAQKDPSKSSTRNSFEVLANEELQDQGPSNPKRTTHQDKTEASQSKTKEKMEEQEDNSKNTKPKTWSLPDMEIDNTDPGTRKELEGEGSYQEPQNKEEDTESLDIGELDILGLELA